MLLLEQDAVIGKTNRIFSKYALKIFQVFLYRLNMLITEK